MKTTPTFEETHGLSMDEIRTLSIYNTERSRGLVHTPEWTARMTELQQRYDTFLHRPIIDPATTFDRISRIEGSARS